MKPGVARFDYTLDFKALDFRQHPELYQIGKGEQGVLLVEPYEGEILPHWRFKTAVAAKKSSAKIYRMFLAYLSALWCKQVRNDAGYWKHLEAHIREQLDVEITHGICPTCLSAALPEPAPAPGSVLTTG